MTALIWTCTVALAATAAFLGVVWRMRCRARRHRSAHAQAVEVLAPPRLDYPTALAAAARFWRDLAGLTRPGWSQFVHGQPHLGLEIHTSGHAMTARLWVPGGLHPRRVEAAVRAAWPGAMTVALGPATDHPPLPPLAGASAGGEVRFGGRGGHDLFTVLHVPDGTQDDPLRALESLGTFLTPGVEHAAIQLLARPAPGWRRRGYRRRLTAALTGRRRGLGAVLARELSAVVCEVLDMVSGHDTARQPYPSGACYPTSTADPVRAEALRAARSKAAGPLWEITARYAATSTDSGPLATHRVGEIAATLLGAFTLFGAARPVTSRRLAHPTRDLAGRRMRRGVLVSVPELAALAHLPTPTPALSGWRTRPVLPPPEHTRPIPPTGGWG